MFTRAVQTVVLIHDLHLSSLSLNLNTSDRIKEFPLLHFEKYCCLIRGDFLFFSFFFENIADKIFQVKAVAQSLLSVLSRLLFTFSFYSVIFALFESSSSL